MKPLPRTSVDSFILTVPVALACTAAQGICAEGWDFSLTEGLRLESQDEKWKFHFGGVYAVQYMHHDEHKDPPSGVYMPIAKPILEGSYDDAWRFRIAGDLKGANTSHNLYEAFVSWEELSWLRLSAGLMPLPLGLENGYYLENLSSITHAYGYYIDYGSDWALRAEGQHGEGLIEWDAAFGIGEGFDANGNNVMGPRLSGRIFTKPLRSWVEPDASWFKRIAGGVFGGVGYLHSWDWDGELLIRDPAGTRMFDTIDFKADSVQFFTYTCGFEVGPVRAYMDDTFGGYNGADTPVGKRDLRTSETTSWQATLSWMITGEHYDGRIFSQNSVKPPGPNAWEIAIRYSNADIDRDFYNFGLTDYTQSSQEFRSQTATLNWYATENLRMSVSVVRIIADDDIEALDEGGRDTIAIFRLQYRF
ncbi:MAG TPA: porin [Verrucomicrobiota bacterium]|nr:porin [Verrucomicrobiota bacterium]